MLFFIPRVSTWEGCFFFDVPLILLNVLPKTSHKTTSDPKVLHGFTTKKGSVPLRVQDKRIKKQLIRSVRLLNSAGGVYFVIAAVPMSL